MPKRRAGSRPRRVTRRSPRKSKVEFWNLVGFLVVVSIILLVIAVFVLQALH